MIRRAIEVNAPDPRDPLDVLSKVGGLDIAGMAGFYLGAALHHVPVVLDGAISAAAALLAVRLCPDAAKALIASHRSAEPSSGLLLDALGLRPIVSADLKLGEGTGAVTIMPMAGYGHVTYRTWPLPRLASRPIAARAEMEALVYGGAASGKSRYAEDLLCALSGEGPRIYLATMEARMRRAGRGSGATGPAAEQGLLHPGVPRDLGGLTIPVGSSVLLEDLGNLWANELFSPSGFDPDGALLRTAEGLERLSVQAQNLVVVSADVFGEEVPCSPETAVYLDGWPACTGWLQGGAAG